MSRPLWRTGKTLRYYDNASATAVKQEQEPEKSSVLVATIRRSITITDRRGREFTLHRTSYHLPPRFYMTYPDKRDLPVLSDFIDDESTGEHYAVFEVVGDVLTEGEPATLMTCDGYTDDFVIRSFIVSPGSDALPRWIDRRSKKKSKGRPSRINS